MTETVFETPVAPATGPLVQILTLYAETALHPGSGSSTGVVDLPIQRERHTGFPLIPPTGIKGSLRQQAERHWPSSASQLHPVVSALFGPRTAATEALHAGAIAFGEARLLAFPVRSTSQVFVWVTCPLVLDRLAHDLQLSGRTLPQLQAAPGPTRGLVPTTTEAKLSREVLLEDLSFRVQERDDVTELATLLATFVPKDSTVLREKMARHLMVIPDQDYEHLVRTGTQVTARIALNDRKTTTGDGGNLWYEETLPRDCLFSVVLRYESPRVSVEALPTAHAVQAHVQALITASPYVQVGGNESIGQGWCALHLLPMPRSTP